jgi:hypothetical protein
MLKIICISVMILTLQGCSQPDPIYICDPLPLPVSPSLFRVKNDEVGCLSQDVYDRLALNRALIHDHAKKLRSIIAKHNQSCAH